MGGVRGGVRGRLVPQAHYRVLCAHTVHRPSPAVPARAPIETGGVAGVHRAGSSLNVHVTSTCWSSTACTHSTIENLAEVVRVLRFRHVLRPPRHTAAPTEWSH